MNKNELSIIPHPTRSHWRKNMKNCCELIIAVGLFTATTASAQTITSPTNAGYTGTTTYFDEASWLAGQNGTGIQYVDHIEEGVTGDDGQDVPYIYNGYKSTVVPGLEVSNSRGAIGFDANVNGSTPSDVIGVRRGDVYIIRIHLPEYTYAAAFNAVGWTDDAGNNNKIVSLGNSATDGRGAGSGDTFYNVSEAYGLIGQTVHNDSGLTLVEGLLNGMAITEDVYHGTESHLVANGHEGQPFIGVTSDTAFDTIYIRSNGNDCTYIDDIRFFGTGEVAVPEPSSTALIGLSSILALVGYRKRK